MDLPLKTPQETFVDEPKGVDDVNIHDLALSIEGGKNINDLHIYEAISIFLHTLKSIMKLQATPEQLAQMKSKIAPVASVQIEDGESTQDSGDDEGPDPTDAVAYLEYLIHTTDLTKSYEIAYDLSSEISNYQDPKVKAQNERVVRLFNLVSPPDVTIEQFLKRIHTYSSAISVSCYIHAAYLIFKLTVVHGVLLLTPCNIHRLTLAALRCLTKKLEDIFQKQKAFATVGGITTKDLCLIEVGFLFLCNFRLVVTEKSLNTYLCMFKDMNRMINE